MIDTRTLISSGWTRTEWNFPTEDEKEFVDVLMYHEKWDTWHKGIFHITGGEEEWCLYNPHTNDYDLPIPESPTWWRHPFAC